MNIYELFILLLTRTTDARQSPTVVITINVNYKTYLVNLNVSSQLYTLAYPLQFPESVRDRLPYLRGKACFEVFKRIVMNWGYEVSNCFSTPGLVNYVYVFIKDFRSFFNI